MSSSVATAAVDLRAESVTTVDFLLRAHRDKAAARRYFEKAIAQNGAPEIVTMDKSGANQAALQGINTERETPVKVLQVKYSATSASGTVGPLNAEPGQ